MNIVKSILSISIILFAIPVHSQNNQYQQSHQGISVIGEAEIRIQPDIVNIIMIIEQKHPKIVEVKKMTEDAVKEVIFIADKNNIKSTEIQRDYIDIDVDIERVQKKGVNGDLEVGKIVEYTQTTLLTIQLKDVGKFESFYSSIIQLPYVKIRDVGFQTTRLKEYRDEVRKIAILAAKNKAIMLTKALGQEIGKAIHIQEINNNWWSPYGRGSSMQRNVGSQNVSYANTLAPSLESQVPPGSLSVKAEIAVVFEIK